ncbi:hypothetical protein KM043_009916 [Ampulex compressa]|nr:hypothetical protein KM043_009916 [Ampulex compressa]
MSGHICKLPRKRDEILTRKSFKDKWLIWCGVYENTPKCDRYVESIAAVAAEARRHADLKYWWIVHPFSYISTLR